MISIKDGTITIDELLTEEGLLLLECWTRDGLSREQIAQRLGITTMTLYNWMKKDERIREAIRKGKEVVDYMVENALLKAALGYTKTETTVYILKQGKYVETKEEKKNIEVGPNTTACLAWLNNKCPDKWKRKADNDVQIDENDGRVTINIVKHKPQELSQTEIEKEDETNNSIDI